MLLRLTLLEIRKRRNAILGWGIGFFLYAAMIMAIAPDLAEQFAQLELQNIGMYQAFGITESIDSVVSLLGVYLPFFGLMLAVYGALTGTNALAGEEDNGTLEMLLAMPTRRVTIVIAKALGILVALGLIALITLLAYAVTFPLIESEAPTSLTMVDFANASWEMIPLGYCFAMIGLLMGAWLPNRATALGVTLALVIGSYLFNNLGGTVNSLENLVQFQPFYYYNGTRVLEGNLDIRRVITLVIVGDIALIIALYAFQRRNVTTGAWPWQRTKVPIAASD